METIILEVYQMLSMKNKKKLEEDYNIDCAYDLEKAILNSLSFEHEGE